jgi:hypothetical protein
MCEYWHTVRNALVPSPERPGISPVRSTRSTPDPFAPGGMRLTSKETPVPGGISPTGGNGGSGGTGGGGGVVDSSGMGGPDDVDCDGDGDGDGWW